MVQYIVHYIFTLTLTLTPTLTLTITLILTLTLASAGDFARASHGADVSERDVRSVNRAATRVGPRLIHERGR